METDSERFMGGLPRWEYILHLFVNGFHFASIAVFMVLKTDISPAGAQWITMEESEVYQWFRLLVINLLPVAVVLGLLHVFVAIPRFAPVWNKARHRVNCC